MNNIVVNIKYGAYLVKNPYRDDLNFFADTEEALISGLDAFKTSYQPKVFRVLGSYQNFKLKALTKKDLETLRENVKSYQKIINKL
jgi:hypothetical protein